MKRLLCAAALSFGCGEPQAAREATRLADTCVNYHFTRQLPGTGLDASVATDGTIVAVSQVDGLHVATVLDGTGTVLGALPLDPFTVAVRAAPRAELVAAAADGRVRRFNATGVALWTAQLDQRATDLAALPDGGVLVSSQAERGVVSYLDGEGKVTATLALRAAPLLAADEHGRIALTGRDSCSAQAPCGGGFDPNRPEPASTAPGGTETSAVVLLDGERRTTGGFISSVTTEQPVGPLFMRAGLVGSSVLVVHATAVARQRAALQVDVDPGSAVALRDVDTEASPDRLLAFAGRKLVWDRGFEPLDDSERAYLVGMFASNSGVAIDINGDVYDTHHVIKLGADGRQQLRYDVPNDGIGNDVRLAGMDATGRIVLSGRFEGSVDFDPGLGQDVLTADAASRRYVSMISACR